MLALAPHTQVLNGLKGRCAERCALPQSCSPQDVHARAHHQVRALEKAWAHPGTHCWLQHSPCCACGSRPLERPCACPAQGWRTWTQRGMLVSLSVALTHSSGSLRAMFGVAAAVSDVAGKAAEADTAILPSGSAPSSMQATCIQHLSL